MWGLKGKLFIIDRFCEAFRVEDVNPEATKGIS
jgi:hypothetical protein